MMSYVPRLLVGAAASGGGKTTVTCGLLRAFQRRGLSPRACKCGPDYIDPMFHARVLGVPSRNLDLFLSTPGDVCRLLAKGAEEAGITVVEGVMGYYDGIALTDSASAWDLARTTRTPAILVLDGRGRARSLAAEVAGFAGFRSPSQVAGVALNRVSPMMYAQLKGAIEEETGIPVLGYLPVMADCELKSRHLGLVTAAEVADLQQRVDRLADQMERSFDLDALVALAQAAPDLEVEPRRLAPACAEPVRVAVARDQAFCFYYEDALDTLRELGADLVGFSPLGDAALPQGVDGLYLGGGYPELHAAQLAANEAMRRSVREAVLAGLPTIAECGGFMYLHEGLEAADGHTHPMVGVIPGRAYRTDHLRRFGYVTLEAKGQSLLAAPGEELRAHEFHYWDSDDPGQAFQAVKPCSGRSWECCHATPTLYAGYPHLNLYSAPSAARRFVEACAVHRQGRHAC